MPLAEKLSSFPIALCSKALISEAEKLESLVENLRKNFNASCKRCGSDLISNYKFDQVLPHVDRTSADVCELFWCHRHSSDEKLEHEKTSHSLSSSKTCHVSDTYIVCQSEIFSQCVWSEERLKCGRCRSVIGCTTPAYQTLKNGDNSLDVGSEVELDLFMIDIHPMFCADMKTTLVSFLIQQQRNSESHRILVEVKDGPTVKKPFLALWMIDMELLSYSASFDLCHDQHINLTPDTEVKVLYKDLSGDNNSLGQLWYKDINVHCTTLTRSACGTLLQILMDGTQLLHPQQRIVNDFYVSVLRPP